MGALRVAAAVVLVAVLAGLALSWRPTIAPIPPPPAASFQPELVRRGAELAAVGDCGVCHTADGGVAFAGGRAIATPFGAVYATNITPDARTGLGGWSRAAFARAMRQGLSRNGAQLYPAFPYDHFRRVSDADLDALYAFLMTRRPAAAPPHANRLIPPLGFRPLVAGWKLLYLRKAPPPLATSSDPEIARGAELVAGLGHCGACHTPHGRLGAEKTARDLDGGMAEGWYAPPLNAKSPAATPWTAARIAGFLKTGYDPAHAAAAGPMGPVAHALSGASDADVRAISAYVAWRMAGAPASTGRPAPGDRRAIADRDHPTGAALFAGACASCHDAGAPMMAQGRPALQLGSPPHEDTPRNVILMIRQGLSPPVGRGGPSMPAFGGSFTDDQMAELVAYVRERFSDRPPWPGLVRAVRDARKEAAS